MTITNPKTTRNQHLIKDSESRTKFITLRCTEDDKQMVDEMSEAYDQSISDLVLNAVRPHCRRLKKKLEK